MTAGSSEAPAALPLLDGVEFTAVAVAHAYGCGGWEPYDGEGGMTTFVRAGHVDESEDGELVRLEDALDELWPFRGSADPPAWAVAAASALGIALPVADLPPVPLWRPDFPGTLGDFLAASRQGRAAGEEAEDRLKDTLRAARRTLLEREGFQLTPADLGSNQRVIVHDYGCRCRCWSGSGGNANQVLAVRGGAAHVMPAGTDIDAVLASAAEAADRAYRDAVARNLQWAERATLPGTGIDDHQLTRDPGSPLLSMTWQQWDQHRRSGTAAAQDKAAQALASGSWAEFVAYARSGWGQFCGANDPDQVRRSAEGNALCSAGVTRLDDLAAIVLHQSLVIPADVDQGQAAKPGR